MELSRPEARARNQLKPVKNGIKINSQDKGLLKFPPPPYTEKHQNKGTESLNL